MNLKRISDVLLIVGSLLFLSTFLFPFAGGAALVDIYPLLMLFCFFGGFGLVILSLVLGRIGKQSRTK